MSSKTSLLGYPNDLIGSYVYATLAQGTGAYLNLSLAMAYKNVQCGGGAFSVSTYSTGPTVVSLKESGLVLICSNDLSTNSTALVYSIQIRQPGDSGFRAVSYTAAAPYAGNPSRHGCVIALPLQAGTEIVVETVADRTTGDDSPEDRYLSVVFLAPTFIRTNVRYGA